MTEGSGSGKPLPELLTLITRASQVIFPANNDILFLFPYTNYSRVRILALVNVLVLLGNGLIAGVLANQSKNLYFPASESKLQLIGYCFG